MAHVIPTLRTASRPTYTPATRHKSNLPSSTGNPATAGDFRTVLRDQSVPAAVGTATPAGTIGTVSPPGTIGTVTPWSPAAAATAPAAPAATASPMAATAQSLFGANPWCTDAGGTGPNSSYSYNSYYFATPQTAARVAQMLGGKVVEMDAITPFGPFKQNQPNRMVQMPDGRLINAGVVAGFYDHGYTQQMVNKMIAAEVSGNLLFS